MNYADTGLVKEYIEDESTSNFLFTQLIMSLGFAAVFTFNGEGGLKIILMLILILLCYIWNLVGAFRREVMNSAKNNGLAILTVSALVTDIRVQIENPREPNAPANPDFDFDEYAHQINQSIELLDNDVNSKPPGNFKGFMFILIEVAIAAFVGSILSSLVDYF